MKGTIPDKEAALILFHALLEKEPYVPVRPKLRAVAAGAVAAGLAVGANGDIPLETAPSPPIPVKPLPANIEAKIRRKVRAFRK